MKKLHMAVHFDQRELPTTNNEAFYYLTKCVHKDYELQVVSYDSFPPEKKKTRGGKVSLSVPN